VFDPTVFDNLKTVLEGALYDLDSANRIRVTGRQDLVDLATMCRTFRMQCTLTHRKSGSAEIELSSELADFAAELAGIRLSDPVRPGCRLRLVYRFSELPEWRDHEPALARVHRALADWWENEAEIEQIVETRSSAGARTTRTAYSAVLTMPHKLDEGHIIDLPAFLEHAIATLEKLHRWFPGSPGRG
jgi:hypothetical protein